MWGRRDANQEFWLVSCPDRRRGAELHRAEHLPKKWKTVGGFIDFGCKRDFFNLFMPLKLDCLVLIGCFVINAWRGWLGLISLCLFRLFVWEESVPERSAVQQWWVLHILGLHHSFAFCFHPRQPFTLTCGISGIKQNDIFPDRRVLITFAP